MMRSNTYALGKRNQGCIFFGKVSGKTRDDTVYNLLEKIVFFENHEWPLNSFCKFTKPLKKAKKRKGFPGCSNGLQSCHIVGRLLIIRGFNMVERKGKVKGFEENRL